MPTKPIEIEIDQPRLAAALAAAVSVVDKRSSNQPILASVLLTADAKGVHIAATDMQVSMREKIDATSIAHGSICIAAEYLSRVVRSLPSKPLRITGLENHWLKVVTGRSEFKLMGQAAADFPDLPAAEPKAVWTAVPAALIRDLIAKVEFSVSADEARVNLCCMLLESDGKTATAVTTDGHRLTKYSAAVALPKYERGILIPRRGLIELRKFVDKRPGEVEFTGSDPSGHLFVRTAQASLAIKLNNVVFPPYQQVIPKDAKRIAIADRADLISVLRRAQVMAPEKTATVRIDFAKGGLKLTADNPDLGTCVEEIDVDYKGEPMAAGYNATYLLEALEVMTTSKVRLGLDGELDPCVLRPVDGPDFLSVVMPMRI
jgi:DNA polymerase III subunit beta